MTTNKAHAALEAERVAREAEGIFDPTAEDLRMIKRYRVLRDRVARDKAEMEAIESAVFAGMGERGARALAVNGKNVALISDTHKTIVDREKFSADYPALSAQYAAAITNYTTRQKVVGGRTAIR